jgi:hypothetical protein
MYIIYLFNHLISFYLFTYLQNKLERSSDSDGLLFTYTISYERELINSFSEVLEC